MMVFWCFCGLNYIRKANQNLNARIKHVPKKISNVIEGPMDNLWNTYGSFIAEHLINNRYCAEKFSVDFFLGSD